jgi:SAM-dependent methyltransferase
MMFKLRNLVPPAVKRYYWRILNDREVRKRFGTKRIKYARETDYWQSVWESNGGSFQNHWYRDIFLAMAGEADDTFCSNKIVADFGCGPQGSLCWATGARARIGIDVLADFYSRFPIAAQNMVYVCSGESMIPLPSNYVDVLFTRNAMDHVDNFPAMCAELLRVLAPGGIFVGDFNLNEPATVCEPQTLTLDYIQENLLRHLKVVHQRVAPCGPVNNRDLYFFEEPPAAAASALEILWVRAHKET